MIRGPDDVICYRIGDLLAVDGAAPLADHWAGAITDKLTGIAATRLV